MQRIQVSDEWLNMLNAHPFRSAKRGRFVHLLKESTKPIKIGKPKKKYEALDVSKMFGSEKRLRTGSENKDSNMNAGQANLAKK